MEYILIIVLICVAVVAYILIRRRKVEEPLDVYVCTQCGQKHCDCTKEEGPDLKNP